MDATNSQESVTREKILHSGTPVWAKSPRTYIEYSRLKESRKADVVIVGAGVSGAFMAHELSRHFESVIVLDRRPPVHGSTSASTAMLQFEIDVPLIELRNQIGATKAVRAWQRSYRATQDLVAIVRKEKIRCDLAPRDGLYLTGNLHGARALHRESQARNRAGLPGEYLSGPTVHRQFGINRTGAIVSPKSAVANPVQLAAGLLRRSRTRGVRIFSPVEIADVMATKHGVMLDTGTHFIECRFCVFCTGYETLKGVPTRGARITSSWAIASRSHAKYPQWLDRTLIWESANPYLYVRTTADGRLVIGGEDEDIDLASYRARSIDYKSARLTAKAEALIPHLTLSIAYRWTGAFGQTDDGLPFIDEVPGMPGCIAVMGFGGNGTVYSLIAAQIVPTLLKGKPDKDADLYRFRD